MRNKIIFAAFVAVAAFAAPTLRAEPMKCSGEEKTCIASCKKTGSVTVSVCVTNCGARGSYCMKTGCWDNGVQRFCGLNKQ
jgi:hypothetical protein